MPNVSFRIGAMGKPDAWAALFGWSSFPPALRYHLSYA
jgi:hypothetical protein